MNNSALSKFVTSKLIEVNDLSSGQYSVNKNKRFKNTMLRSDLCHYSDSYFVEKGKIDLLGKKSTLLSRNNGKEKSFPRSATYFSKTISCYLVKLSTDTVHNKNNIFFQLFFFDFFFFFFLLHFLVHFVRVCMSVIF